MYAHVAAVFQVLNGVAGCSVFLALDGDVASVFHLLNGDVATVFHVLGGDITLVFLHFLFASWRRCFSISCT